MSTMERKGGFWKRNTAKGVRRFFDKRFDWIVLIIVTLIMLLAFFL